MITMCWTLQFIRPLRRDNLIRRIYDALVDEGVLIVTEKILTNNGHMNRFFVDFYYEFKGKQGYSDTEIARKREALENVLIPYRLEEESGPISTQWFSNSGDLFPMVQFRGISLREEAALPPPRTHRCACAPRGEPGHHRSIAPPIERLAYQTKGISR